MTEEPEKKGAEPTEEEKSAQAEAWREVGAQFQALGESLAAAFRAAWTDEQNRRYLEDARTGLQKMAEDVGKAVKDASVSEQGKKAREQAEKAAEAARKAGKQTAEDTRPYLVQALRQLRDAVQKAITRLEEEEK